MWIELRKMLDDYDSHFVPYANQSEGICVFWRKHRCVALRRVVPPPPPLLTHASWVMRQAATVPLAPNRTSAIAAHLVFRDHERPEEELAIVTAQLSSDPKKESFRPDEVCSNVSLLCHAFVAMMHTMSGLLTSHEEAVFYTFPEPVRNLLRVQRRSALH